MFREPKLFASTQVRLWFVVSFCVIPSMFLGACAQTLPLQTASLSGVEQKPVMMEPPKPDASRKPTPEQLQAAIVYWARAYAANPKNPESAIAYSRNLEAAGEQKKALAVLRGATIANPDSKEISAAHGKIALKLGQIKSAQRLLARATDPNKPDWRIISAQGAAIAKQGRYAEAVPYFERALALKPGRASIVNNLAMAYALDGDTDRAETLLRKVANNSGAEPRVRQNLALVLGLQGRFDEAERVASADLPAHKAKQRVAYMRGWVKAKPVSASNAKNPTSWSAKQAIDITTPLPVADLKPANAPVQLTSWDTTTTVASIAQ